MFTTQCTMLNGTPKSLNGAVQKHTLIHSNHWGVKYHTTKCLIVHIKVIAWKLQTTYPVCSDKSASDPEQPPGLSSEVSQSEAGLYPYVFISSGSRRGTVLLPSHVPSLLLGETGAFPALTGHVIPPVRSGLAQGSSASSKLKEPPEGGVCETS